MSKILETLQPIFDEIAADAPRRERDHRFDHEAVDKLRDAGFFKIRIPKANGGLDLSLEEAFDVLVGLAAADSNLAQGLRPHYLAIENLRVVSQPEYRDYWLGKIATENLVVGNALTEKNNELGDLKTRLIHDGGRLVLNGTKFYSTGALYADIIQVLARTDDDTSVYLFVDAHAPGIERIDDWHGFGQQLTASGTTHFNSVIIPPEAVEEREFGALDVAQVHAQAHHLSSLTGIAAAIERDTIAYVRNRTRVYSHGNADLPRYDPQIQHVVGLLASARYGSQQALSGLVRELAVATAQSEAGKGVSEDAIEHVTLTAYLAQQVIAPTVLGAATELFEVGGASATNQALDLDRHWRNARVLASHNPIIFRTKIIGDVVLNGASAQPQYLVGSVPQGKLDEADKGGFIAALNQARQERVNAA